MIVSTKLIYNVLQKVQYQCYDNKMLKVSWKRWFYVHEKPWMLREQPHMSF